MQNTILWSPSKERIENSYLKKFILDLNKKFVLSLSTYDDLHAFSVHEHEKFWSFLWDFSEIVGIKGDVICENPNSFQSVKWFPEAQLNYAENILESVGAKNQIALLFNGENQVYDTISFGELHRDVSKMVQFFKDINLKCGDRIALLANNAPQTVVCVLAASALGIVCSLCATDFGAQGIAERISQIEPVLFIYFDTAIYNGKLHSQIEKIQTLVPQIASLKNIVRIHYIQDAKTLTNKPTRNFEKLFSNEHSYEEIMQRYPAKKILYERVNFSHPLYIVYSSGTTGVPKCIVHGHGGVLLQHKKEHLLHCDIKPNDRVFYYTTCGWMMWQWLISTLSVRATAILYDGSPFQNGPHALLQYLNENDVSFFGTSAKYIDTLRKQNENIKEQFSFSKLKTIGSTGSALSPANFDYVYAHWKKDVCLSSLSGGTDILSCFVLGCPIKPVRRGEIQCLGLGMNVDVFDETGHSVRGLPGELVCKIPFPSMPVYFWNDKLGEKYKKSYFERFENTWCHGDWAIITEDNGCIILGRSDTTLNPGGVRIGTAEIYRQLEQFDEVLESVVTEYDKNGDGDSCIVLFVKMKNDIELTEKYVNMIKEKIRLSCTPRHVPNMIFKVLDIPKTKSGKIMEIAVKHSIHGKTVPNLESCANPESLLYFKNLISRN